MGRPTLVTGGAGFVGSHLCEALLDRDDDVICCDDLTTGSIDNLAHLRGNPRFTFRQHDVTQPISEDVGIIYNLACPASPARYQTNPIQTTKTSVLGAINILELARTKGASVLQASTSEVYGDPAVHPQTEVYWGHVNPIGPRACYDEGKRCAETLFFDYRRMHGVDTKVVRIFNTYGPRMDPKDGRVVSNFIVQALRGDDLTIYGDGSQTRSFCYVDDLVTALIRVMGTGTHFSGPVNLGNPVEFTVRQLADLVIDMTNSTSSVIHRSLPIDDPRQRKPDISLARTTLGWEPDIRLREGLARTIEYFDNLLSKSWAENDLTSAES